jgi:hypothetical protein
MPPTILSAMGPGRQQSKQPAPAKGEYEAWWMRLIPPTQ